MAKRTSKSKTSTSMATSSTAPATDSTTNVRIKNLLNQSVKVSLQRPHSRLVEVTLPPRGELPNKDRPAAIAVEEVTTYTRGLEGQKRIRITEVA